MRRLAVFLVVAVVAVTFGSPAAWAQAPAPKVTITGFVDFVTSAYKNIQDNIVTNDDDDGWYSRERGVFTLTGEVGKSKAVFAFELDFTNGQGGPASNGTSSNFDLDTDVPGFLETKWLYAETPITGPGSLLPFIPVESIGRFGAQPAAGHAYKPGILWSGDFPGVNLVTTWAPNLRSTLTYAQIGEALSGFNAGAKVSEDRAFLASVEFDVFKGLTVKPTYAYAEYDGGNSGTANLGTEPKGGFSTNVAGGGTGLRTERHYIGGDVRWTAGGFSLQPTFIYSWGTQDVTATTDVDISTWIFDVIGGYRIGPLNIEGRFAWTPGMEARECVQAIAATATTAGCAGGEDINYYQPINSGFVYQAGWAEIQTSGIDYNLVSQSGGPGLAGGPGGSFRLGENPSYDKYGRITAAAAVDYSVTPALTLHFVTNWQWTAEEVDTDGVFGANGLTPTGNNNGKERFLGHEYDVGFTYRFAPNVAFDLIGGYLFAGDARGFATASVPGGPRDPEDIWKISSRIRVSF